MNGFPVPDGVVLVADALDDALAAAGLAGHASAEAVAGLELPEAITVALHEAVRRWVDRPLAVRSSGVDVHLASASYAGLYTTVL